MAKVFVPNVAEISTEALLFPAREDSPFLFKIKDGKFLSGVKENPSTKEKRYWGMLQLTLATTDSEAVDALQRKEPTLRHTVSLNFSEEESELGQLAKSNPALGKLLKEFDLHTKEENENFMLGIDMEEVNSAKFPQDMLNNKYFANIIAALKGKEIEAYVKHQPRRDNKELQEAVVSAFVYTKE